MLYPISIVILMSRNIFDVECETLGFSFYRNIENILKH